MFIQQLYTNCLAEAAYYIESNGEAVIIDPIRETELYIELAKSRGAKIKYVFETHFHADFVSGHIDLAKQTGATIVFGPLADTSYEIHHAIDGEEFKIGDLTIRTLHTPGHTPESSCYLLLDKNFQEYCVFTGDTLFVGDVGRPDLLDGKMSSRELASMLYDSLNKKIKTLPDEVIVYPAHGPGSACGKNIGQETWSTIGEQKKTNYALGNLKKDEFVNAVVEGLSAPPAYFFEDARINKQGYDSINLVMKKNLRALSVDVFKSEIIGGALILDTRNSETFEKGFIKGSINIGLDGMFAIWAGTILNIDRRLVIVCDIGKEEETISRLARVGYENISGFLDGGFECWKKNKLPSDSVSTIEPKDFAGKAKEGVQVLDVRKFSEAENGYVKNASVIPLEVLEKNHGALNKNETLYVHCAGGYRSMIAASILKSHGFDKIVNIKNGWNMIKDSGVAIETGTPQKYDRVAK